MLIRSRWVLYLAIRLSAVLAALNSQFLWSISKVSWSAMAASIQASGVLQPRKASISGIRDITYNHTQQAGRAIIPAPIMSASSYA
ncbi:hypothetical protein D3C75_1101340 [compost metagenome]